MSGVNQISPGGLFYQKTTVINGTSGDILMAGLADIQHNTNVNNQIQEIRNPGGKNSWQQCLTLVCPTTLVCAPLSLTRLFTHYVLRSDPSCCSGPEDCFAGKEGYESVGYVDRPAFGSGYSKRTLDCMVLFQVAVYGGIVAGVMLSQNEASGGAAATTTRAPYVLSSASTSPVTRVTKMV